MTDRREHHERHAREFSIQDGVIEIQGPDGVKQVSAPSDWGIHDITAVRKLLEAAGYTVAVPETDALFAYAPKVHADEAGPFESTTADKGSGSGHDLPLESRLAIKRFHEADAQPLDSADTSLCERLSLIPGTRAHSLKKTPTGLSGRLTDYGSGRTLDVRLDDVQPELREVKCPDMVQHDGSDDCPVHRDATVIAYFKGGHTNIAGGGSPAGCIKWRNVTWYRITDAEAAVEAVNGREA